ncbi:MAG: hypothetical protein DCF32_12745 [Leptolyngbya sp.]|nr:MAG: hypothetical protein DCF32_12745 [Leptolyngbya sp.]
MQIWVGARSQQLWRGPLGLVLVGLGLCGGLLLLGLSFRLGLRLMLDPEALPQALARLQRSQSVALPAAIGLEELRQQATASQQQVGEPLRLEILGTQGREVLIVPVLKAGAIASLHLFGSEGSGEERLRAIATLPVTALPKDTVLTPWLSSPQAPTAAPTNFKLTRLVPLPAPPIATDGLWLTLEGSWQQQGLTLRYGQLLHVDPQAQRLELLAPWSSPVNRPPQWADLDGDGPSDLVIDETVGLEPALRGFQVTPGPRLQSVSWVRVPVDAGAHAGHYQQALRLARGGLWHPAQTQLANLKPALGQGWNPAAEAQLRLMARHGAISRQQAEQDWSTPSQHIMALLIDGQWEPALTRLETSPELLPTLLNRLAVDQGRLWNRISAAAALPDPPPAVYVWGGLALKAQQNQPSNRDGATLDWLNRQPVPVIARQRLAKVLATLTTAQTPSVASAKPGATAAIAPRQSPSAGAVGNTALPPLTALIGQARPISAPESGYAAPGQALDAALGQWYAIDLRAVHQNQVWQPGTGALPAQTTPAVWAMVQPAAQASPQLLRWISPTTGVSAPLIVRGLSLTNGTTTLLATGPAASASALPPLVFSQGALMWLDASQGETAEPGAIAAAIFGNPPLPVEAMADVAQHSLDLTDDGQIERVLTWDGAALMQLKNWRTQVETTFPKTIILDADNRLLYSDMFASQTVVALTNPAVGGSVGLLVYRAGGYELLSWQTAERQFK